MLKAIGLCDQESEVNKENKLGMLIKSKILINEKN